MQNDQIFTIIYKKKKSQTKIHQNAGCQKPTTTYLTKLRRFRYTFTIKRFCKFFLKVWACSCSLFNLHGNHGNIMNDYTVRAIIFYWKFDHVKLSLFVYLKLCRCVGVSTASPTATHPKQRWLSFRWFSLILVKRQIWWAF